MKLRDARKDRGWTQAMLAERARVRQQLISRMERGDTHDPGHRAVMRICRALDLDPSDIDEFGNGGKR